MKLTDKTLKAAKPRDKTYKLADGQGLYVSVLPTGSMVFRYDFRLGKSATLTLGHYNAQGGVARAPEALEYGDPALTLAEARVLHQRALRLVRERRDPRRSDTGLFKGAAEGWYTEGSTHWRTGTAKLYRRVLDNYLLPELALVALGDLRRSRVLDLCRDVFNRKAKPGDRCKGGVSPARMCREIVSMVYDWHNGESDTPLVNPAKDIRPDRKIAPRAPSSARRLEAEHMPVFLKALKATDDPRADVLWLILYSLARKGEVLGASRDEVRRGVWVVPAERMKEGREHVVALPRQAMPFVKRMPLVMHPGYPNKLLTRLLKDAKLPHIGPHDLRRTAATILNEAGTNRDDVDRCLAHVVGSTTSRVYDAAERLDERRALLQRWADMLDGWLAA